MRGHVADIFCDWLQVEGRLKAAPSHINMKLPCGLTEGNAVVLKEAALSEQSHTDSFKARREPGVGHKWSADPYVDSDMRIIRLVR